jgi:hypothetical protein
MDDHQFWVLHKIGPNVFCQVPAYIYICEILPKSENSKFRNEVILKVFNSQKVRGKNSKITKFQYWGFECVAKDIEG